MSLLRRCESVFLRQPDYFVQLKERKYKGHRVDLCEREGQRIGLLESLVFLE
jgi:hypothetical protein